MYHQIKNKSKVNPFVDGKKKKLRERENPHRTKEWLKHPYEQMDQSEPIDCFFLDFEVLYNLK